MKKPFLLVLVLITSSVYAQTDSLKRSTPDNERTQFVQDSLRQKHIQDSIRDKELMDIINPGQIQETPKVVPATPLPPPPDTTKPKQPIVDTLAQKKQQDSLKTKLLQPDTSKSKLSADTTRPKSVPPDTLKPKIEKIDTVPPRPIIPDSLKKTTGDTLNVKPIAPRDTVKPSTALDSLKSQPPDSLKQTVVAQPKLIPPDSLRKMPLDSLTPEQLQEYYINEPEPISFYKGPNIGDSVYYVLNPQVVPTQTVYGDPLSIRKLDSDGEVAEVPDTANNAEQMLKPKISLGVGRMGFDGDIYNRHFQSPALGRAGFDLAISQRMTRYLQLDFNVLFGKLGANEIRYGRNENFQSEIRAGGVNLLYDFGNFIPDRYSVRPFVSFGAYGFEFLSKTDLKDKNGSAYYYWSDGSIKDKAEGAPDAQFAKDLVRDYSYESDIRELNRDGFGKYQERAWAFPVGAGFVMKVTDRVDLKLNFQYFFSTTDYIDGITSKSIEERAGTRRKDCWTYTSFAFQYDLISKYTTTRKYVDTLSNSDWFAIDNEDSDNDSVPDMRDDCQGTPANAKVNEKGCPVDDDGDGIPNYRDDELTTPPGSAVNGRGVAQNDAYWQAWYDQYMNDSLATDRITEYTGNIYAVVTKKPKVKKDNFTVELVRYTGSIPSDELAFLLSIGDINSTTLEDGTTVVYTTGSYDKLSVAMKRRDEFRTEGNKAAGISRIQGKEIVQVPEDELQRLLQSEIEDLLNVSVSDSSAGTVLPEEAGMFSKEDVVYRVQLGAFKNKISTKVFNTSAGVLELKTGESVYRYVTKGYKSIEEAAGVRADLVVQGYSDAFVTAYKGGKRIPMNQTNATMDKSYKEDLSEDKVFNSIDKKLLSFKVQLGPLKKKAQEQSMDEKVKGLSGVEKQTTSSGSIRYTAGGEFANFDAAEKYRKDLEDKGYTDAFIIATFKGEIISMQEAMELLK
jgi:hypothetical protein